MAFVLSRVSAPVAPRTARSGASARRSVVVRSEEPRVTLESNNRTAEGYVEKDTAGQANMYPSVMKPFEAGSAQDTVQLDAFNENLAVGTTVVAMGAIGLGLAALINGSPSAPVVAEEYTAVSLTELSAKFAQELAPRAAPAPAVVLEAPAVVEAPAAVEAPAV